MHTPAGPGAPDHHKHPREGLGQIRVTQPAPYTISGCSLPSTGAPPCVTATWVTAAARVTADGMPCCSQQPGHVRYAGNRSERDPDTDPREGQLMNLAYPFTFQGRGRTATVGEERHILNMIEELIFTSPGSA